MSYETIRRWCTRFGPTYANRLRKKDRCGGDRWFVDEVFVRIDGELPRRLMTDKLRSYAPAHRDVMPGSVHDTRQYANHRAELSHEPTRQRERRMRRFKSIGHAQLFLAVHGTMQNLFAIPRHLFRAKHYRAFRARAFDRYEQVTCA